MYNSDFERPAMTFVRKERKCWKPAFSPFPHNVFYDVREH